jgi:hypothetical protein
VAPRPAVRAAELSFWKMPGHGSGARQRALPFGAHPAPCRKGTVMTPRHTVVVPAAILADLRTGLYAQIGIAGEQLDSLTAKSPTGSVIPSGFANRYTISSGLARCWI